MSLHQWQTDFQTAKATVVEAKDMRGGPGEEWARRCFPSQEAAGGFLCRWRTFL